MASVREEVAKHNQAAEVRGKWGMNNLSQTNGVVHE
jgi:hypothetical protein